MTKSRKEIRLLLTSALAQASIPNGREARKGTSVPQEFAEIPASDLMRFLECEQLVKDCLEGKTESYHKGQVDSAKAVTIVTTLEAGGHPFAAIKWALHRVLDRFDGVGRKRAELYREAERLGMNPGKLTCLPIVEIEEKLGKIVEQQDRAERNQLVNQVQGLVNAVNAIEERLNLETRTTVKLDGAQPWELKQLLDDLQDVRAALLAKAGKKTQAA